MGDWELLQAYAKNRSETAFAELVRLHVDWVHSVALRHVGDPHLAEDVVQSVFVLLARKASDLRPGTVLGGWLFRTTCHVAAHARRAELRRKSRETIACTMSNDTNSQDNTEILWQQLAPHLDLAVSALSEADRSAILLRFYEKAPMRTVGERLGVSEDAAKKRVSRAVERMRDFLAERGVKFGGVVLAGLLAEKTVQAAPAAMAAAAAKIAVAAGSASTSVMLPPLARETLRAWHWAKAKLAAGLAVSSVALIVVKGGEAVLWLLPQDFVPSTHLVHQQRGDLGQFILEDGVRLSGQVFDSDGLRVSHVWVNAELSGGPAKKPIDMPVADAMARSALTDAQGHFATGPLPPGAYDVLISEYPRDSIAEDRTRYPVPDVFLHQKLQIPAGQATQTMEIRAVPHVVLAIQQLDGQGRPHKTHDVHVSGRFGNTGWWGQESPDQDGRIVVKVPQGLADARISLMVNEHQSTRYRWSHETPWRNEHEMTAAILDHDALEISVTYYTAPILLIRAVAEDGSAIPAFKCRIDYANDRKPFTQPPHWINGDAGDVSFEKQQDGRWRSTCLLPNEDLSLTVEAEGFQAWSQTINLPEGASQEIEAKLQKQ